MPILAIDAGNTRIKWGLWEDRGFIAQGALLTARAGELADALHMLARPDRVVGCSVADSQVRSQIDQALAAWGARPQWIVGRRTQCGVVSRYAEPEQLGADRWAALIGARVRHSGDAVVVVNVGTAVTIDALSAEGEFLGGLILPGPELMAEVLATGTAGLPRQQGRFELFPTSTANAIFSGSLQAVCGAIERIERALAVAGPAEPQIVMSGGSGDLVASQLGRPVTLAPNLVLEGLIAVARS
jgi:type III pantothenate kinase